MPIFKVVTENKKGRKKNEIIVGLNEASIVAALHKKEKEALSLTPADNDFEVKINKLINRVGIKDIVIFSRQFSVMISANVPVVESLITLIDQTDNFSLKNMIAEIATMVEAGALLSDAMERFPRAFSEFFVSIVRSGETSGKLDEVLDYLADEMEKNYDMSSKIKGAMIYPVFIMVALTGVGVVLMVYVIPNITSMMTDSNMNLPISTRIIIWISNFMRDYSVMIILFIIGVVIAARMYLKTYQGRKLLDTFLLRMPIFGPLFRYIYLMRFTRSLSTLLKGGVTITKSLTIVAGVVGNVVYKEIINNTLQSINDGNPFSTVMENSRDIPKMVPEMIAVGERTGKLDVVLDRVTEFYSREADKMLNNLSALMEPIIMTVMGVGVGIMVAAVLMPMYNLAGQF